MEGWARLVNMAPEKLSVIKHSSPPQLTFTDLAPYSSQLLTRSSSFAEDNLRKIRLALDTSRGTAWSRSGSPTCQRFALSVSRKPQSAAILPLSALAKILRLGKALSRSGTAHWTHHRGRKWVRRNQPAPFSSVSGCFGNGRRLDRLEN